MLLELPPPGGVGASSRQARQVLKEESDTLAFSASWRLNPRVAASWFGGGGRAVLLRRHPRQSGSSALPSVHGLWRRP